MSQCKYEVNKQRRLCPLMANASGYCPRHEALIPALEAEALKKEKAKRAQLAANNASRPRGRR